MSRSMTVSGSLWRTAMATAAVCSGLFLAVASPALASPVPAQVGSITCAATYVVKAGDDLFRIAMANGTTWPVLQQLNGISNPNLLFVGQSLCLANPTLIATPVPLPTTVGVPTPITISTPVAPVVSGLVLPPPGVFPSISLDHYYAQPGDTITISGVNFPTNGVADVFIKPLTSPEAYMVAAQTTTSPTGTVSYAFTIPTVVGGQTLTGYAFSVLVKERTTSYFGFNFFYNGLLH